MRGSLQVVIAGASETGLACLEGLLLHPSLQFTNLTLLAPGERCATAALGAAAPGGAIRMHCRWQCWSDEHCCPAAAGGIAVGGVTCRYTSEVVQRLGLGTSISVVDAALTGFDLSGDQVREAASRPPCVRQSMHPAGGLYPRILHVHRW
jgi:hypothetical protein